jgi:hypothetical protein
VLAHPQVQAQQLAAGVALLLRKGPVLAQTLVAGPGKYWVYHSGFPIRRKGDDSDKHSGSTGRVELEIEGAPDAKR